MRFPGHRNPKHYFPVADRAGMIATPETPRPAWYAPGIDHVLVDMEVHAPLEVAIRLGLVPSESINLDQDAYRRVLARIEEEGLPVRYAPGGTVANTLNNYTFLSGEGSVLLGSISSQVPVGGAAFH
ncbi:MAG: inosine kinase [Myxococcota bacterium]|jgi:inosine kinase